MFFFTDEFDQIKEKNFLFSSTQETKNENQRF